MYYKILLSYLLGFAHAVIGAYFLLFEIMKLLMAVFAKSVLKTLQSKTVIKSVASLRSNLRYLITNIDKIKQTTSTLSIVL